MAFVSASAQLASNEDEVSRLTSELRRLRSYYLQGAPLIVHDAEIVVPPEEASKAGSRAVLLGDAEAELLLQAGKTRSHVRRIQRIPLDKAIQEQAEEIVQAIVPFPVDPPQSSPHSAPRSRLPSSQSYSVPPVSYQLPVPPSLRGHRTDAVSLACNNVVNDDNEDSLPSISANLFDDDSLGLPIPPPSFATSSSSDFPRARETVETLVEKTSPSATALFGLPTVRPVQESASTSRQARPLGKLVGRTPSALDLLSEAAGAMHSNSKQKLLSIRIFRKS